MIGNNYKRQSLEKYFNIMAVLDIPLLQISKKAYLTYLTYLAFLAPTLT
jgi:hypothetical protein